MLLKRINVSPKDYLTLRSNSSPSHSRWRTEVVRALTSSVEILKTLSTFWNDYTSCLSISKSLITQHCRIALCAGPVRGVSTLANTLGCLPLYGYRIVWKMRPSLFYFPLHQNLPANKRMWGTALPSTQEHKSYSFCQQRQNATWGTCHLRQKNPLWYFPVWICCMG